MSSHDYLCMNVGRTCDLIMAKVPSFVCDLYVIVYVITWWYSSRWNLSHSDCEEASDHFGEFFFYMARNRGQIPRTESGFQTIAGKKLKSIFLQLHGTEFCRRHEYLLHIGDAVAARRVLLVCSKEKM